MNIENLLKYNIALSVISFLLSWLIIYAIIPLFRKLLIQIPNVRSSHTKPIPSGGGIVFVIIGSLFSALLGNFIPLIFLPLAIIGLLDDLFEINKKIRLFAQILTSILIVYKSTVLEIFSNNTNQFLIILISITLVVLAVSIINFLNFMDGLDGLVSSFMVIYLGIFVFSHSPNLLPLLTSILAFSFWNFPPARIFMGDVGSTFLGGILVACIFYQKNLGEFIAYFLLASPLLFDALFCLLRRVLSSQEIFEPHKLHLYQRLHQSGWTHFQVSFLYCFSTIILSLTYLFFGINSLIIGSLLIIPLGIFVDTKYATSFIAEK